MKEQLKIEVGGREYPCRATMGAMLRFERVTGREVTKVDLKEVSLLCVWLWCCVVSACNADGVEFGLKLEDFCDRVSPDMLSSRLGSSMDSASVEPLSEAGVSDEKKS